jgi:hypothetical protein
LVSMAEWNHSDPFPNSVVKHSCGDDSWGVAPCQNSSMPSLILEKAPNTVWGFFMLDTILVKCCINS